MFPENTGYTQTQTHTVGFDAGLRTHMQRIYNRMTMGVLITALVSYVVAATPALFTLFFGQGGPTLLGWAAMLAPLAVVWFGFNPVRMSANAMRGSFILLSVLYGISFATIFVAFTGESIARTFFIATAMFAGISIFSYSTKKDLTALGTFAMMGIWGVFIATIIAMVMPMLGFEPPTMMSNIIAGVGILAFSGLTAWQTQQMKEMYSPQADGEMMSRMSWMAALNLYISFVAIFQYLLQFLGQRE